MIFRFAFHRHLTNASVRSTSVKVSTVLVNFPDGTQVVVPFKEDTRLIHLLSKISKTKRLRLYTNEYVFAVSTADQKRLKVRYMGGSCDTCSFLAFQSNELAGVP
jgi:hypothetical protein